MTRSSVAEIRSQGLGRRGFGECLNEGWVLVAFLPPAPLPPPYLPRQKLLTGAFSFSHCVTGVLGSRHQVLALPFLLRIRKANGCTVPTY